MSFSAHTSHMKKICEELQSLTQAGLVEKHVCALLEHVCANEEHFDASITPDSPFYTEFFTHICAQSSHPEHCFALLECLIVFCRERQLRLSAQDISPAEKELLQYFEQSHHWHEADATLIGQWYWRTLPMQYGHLVPA